MSGATVQLDSVPLFREVLFHYLPAALKKANAAQHNKSPYVEIARELSKIDEVLLKAGTRLTPAEDLEGCTILHQLRYTALQAQELCDQYEDPEGPSPAVLAEVYNEQLKRVLGRLRALSTALSEQLSDGAKVTVRMAEDLPQQVLHRPHIDYAKYYPPNITQSLPQLLSENVDSGNNPFLTKAMWGQWLEVDRMLLEDPAHANDFGLGLSMLHCAVLWQNSFAVAMLLGYGAQVDCQTKGEAVAVVGSTPLHIAAVLGNVALVRLLIAWGASLTIPDSEGRIAPQVPTNAHCRSLFNSAPQILDKSREACSYAFHGQFTRLRDVLQKYHVPVDVKFKASSRFFLLHQIAFGGNREMYYLVLEAGASPLVRSADTLLPSTVAEMSNHTGLAASMRQREAEAERCDPDPKPRPLGITVSPERILSSPPMSTGGQSREQSHSLNVTPERSPTRRSPLKDAYHAVKDGVRRRFSRSPTGESVHTVRKESSGATVRKEINPRFHSG